jgi:hypothetical protein
VFCSQSKSLLVEPQLSDKRPFKRGRRLFTYSRRPFDKILWFIRADDDDDINGKKQQTQSIHHKLDTRVFNCDSMFILQTLLQNIYLLYNPSVLLPGRTLFSATRRSLTRTRGLLILPHSTLRGTQRSICPVTPWMTLFPPAAAGAVSVLPVCG